MHKHPSSLAALEQMFSYMFIFAKFLPISSSNIGQALALESNRVIKSNWLSIMGLISRFAKYILIGHFRGLTIFLA